MGVTAPTFGVPAKGSGVPGVFIEPAGVADGFTGCGKKGRIWQAARKKANIGMTILLEIMFLLCAIYPDVAS